jgi:hypothetical protein
VHVVNEDGTAVNGAEVTIYSDRTGASKTILFSGVREGRTNSRGCFSGTVWTFDRIGVLVTGKGYYFTRVWIGLKGTRLYEDWLPYSRNLTITLRKMIKPTSMYARRFHHLRLPVLGQPLGYDLIKGDWVKPHGKGEHADIQLTGKFGDDTSSLAGSSLRISVPGKGNGLAPISREDVYATGHFRLPRSAPDGGYTIRETVHSWVAPFRKKSDCAASVPAEHFFMRVRAGQAGDSKAEGPLYGKLIGPIYYNRCIGTKKMAVYLSYCLNPTPNDRNVEWDSQKNLLKGDEPLVY